MLATGGTSSDPTRGRVARAASFGGFRRLVMHGGPTAGARAGARPIATEGPGRLVAPCGADPAAGTVRRRRGGLLRVLAGVSLALGTAGLLADAGLARAAGSEPRMPGRPLRIVSMSPAATAMVIALGAADLLVGIDEYSARQHPELGHLPRVGGLYSPSLEAVASLHPDRVLLVPSAEQRGFRNQLEALGIAVEPLGPVSFGEILGVLEHLGALLGRPDRASERIREIQAVRDRLLRERPPPGGRPRVLLVLDRSPLFVAGGGTFLDELITIAGGANLGAELPGPYPRASLEWVLAAAPEVILDSTAAGETPAAWWGRFPSLPAVRAGRVHALDPEAVTLPGPYLDRALLAVAEALRVGRGAGAAPGIAAEAPTTRPAVSVRGGPPVAEPAGP